MEVGFLRHPVASTIGSLLPWLANPGNKLGAWPCRRVDRRGREERGMHEDVLPCITILTAGLDISTRPLAYASV